MQLNDSDPVNLSAGAAKRTAVVVRAAERTAKNERGRNLRWPIPEGGDSGGYMVLFSVISYDAAYGSALCQILYRFCSQPLVPDEDDDEQITIYDPMACMFDEAAADLVGRKGWAAYMKPTEDVDADQVCVWAVFSLCCPP
jgi:hypothetical protein